MICGIVGNVSGLEILLEPTDPMHEPGQARRDPRAAERIGIARERQSLGIGTLVAPLTPATLASLHLPWPTHTPPVAAPRPTVRYEVLLVEDNEVNRLVGQGFLEALGLDVLSPNLALKQG